MPGSIQDDPAFVALVEALGQLSRDIAAIKTALAANGGLSPADLALAEGLVKSRSDAFREEFFRSLRAGQDFANLPSTSEKKPQ